MFAKMNIAAVLLLLPFVCLADEEYYTTVEDAKQLIQDGQTFMIAFTTKQCPHCIKLGQQIPEIATAFAKADVDAKFFKMDVNEDSNRAFVNDHEVDGVPTIYLYMANSAPVKYTGEREPEAIAYFVKKMLNLAVRSVDSAESLAAFTSDGVVAVSVADDSVDINLLDLARANLDIAFVTVTKKVAEELGLAGALVVIRSDGKLALSAEDVASKEEKEISSWVKMAALPSVVSFPERSGDIFGAGVDSIVFFIHTSIEDVAWLKEVAEGFRGQLVVAFLDRNNEAGAHVLQFFGLDKESDKPDVRVYHVEKRKQFSMNTEVTPESVTKFFEEYVAGDVAPQMKSEALPEDWNQNPVKVLVGTNFNEVAMDTTKFVFVEFYAPWCGHCKKLAPEWDALAEMVADKENVIIAKLDATANDLDDNHKEVQGFPTLRLYTPDNTVVEYSGERNALALSKWLNSQVGVETATASDDAAVSSDETAAAPEEHEEL